MTEQELRAKVIDQAASWLGRNEADGTHCAIIDVYNGWARLHGLYVMSYADPWCAAYVAAVAVKCGLADIIPPYCNCESMIQWFRSHGRWEEDDAYRPEAGDLVMYDWDDDGKGDDTGEADHVGIVTCVDGNEITVIEGNSSDRVQMRRIAVDQRFIRGYGRPDYAAKADGNDERDGEPDEGGDEEHVEAAVPLPVLANGDTGTAVLAMQAVLGVRGYKCGSYGYGGWGADGEFGPATEAALKNFQKRCGIEDDGVCGPVTWAYLLGVRK